MPRRYVYCSVGYAANLRQTWTPMRGGRNGDPAISNSLPIGVFDSGVGGLTVLRALLDRLPGEDFVYLGDTARLPYGTKSPGSIRQYSLQAARLLHERGVKCLVVACNTASAIALDALTHEFDPVPVIGVLEPGAAAACLATRAGRIAVLATESTVRGGAYQAAITRRRPDAIVSARACPLFVALAEEGWTDGPIVEGVIHRYLDERLRRRCSGCTSRHAAARLHALPGARACAAQGTGTGRRDRRFGGRRRRPRWRTSSASMARCVTIRLRAASRCSRPMARNALHASGRCFSADPWRRPTWRSSTSRLRRCRQAPELGSELPGQGSRSRVAMPAGR